MKSQEELVHELKYKPQWKAARAYPDYLNPLPIIRGAVLSEWEAQRTLMPERNYRMPKGALPIRYGNAQSSYFSGDIYKNNRIYSKEFQKKITKWEVQYKNSLGKYNKKHISQFKFKGFGENDKPKGANRYS